MEPETNQMSGPFPAPVLALSLGVQAGIVRPGSTDDRSVKMGQVFS